MGNPRAPRCQRRVGMPSVSFLVIHNLSRNKANINFSFSTQVWANDHARDRIKHGSLAAICFDLSCRNNTSELVHAFEVGFLWRCIPIAEEPIVGPTIVGPRPAFDMFVRMFVTVLTLAFVALLARHHFGKSLSSQTL